MKLDRFEWITVSGGLLALLMAFGVATSASAASGVAVCVCLPSTGECGPPEACPTGPTTGLTPAVAVGGAVICKDGSCLAVSLGGSNTEFTTPAGWSGVNTPPATSTPTAVTYRCNPATCGSTLPVDSSLAAACERVRTTLTTGISSAVSGHTCTITYNSPTAPSSIDLIDVNVCPAGYAGNPTCNLTTASAVQRPADGKVNVKRSGNIFTIDPQDQADLATLDPLIVVNSSTLQASSGGDTRTITLDPTTGKLQLISSHYNGDGTSTVTTVNLGNPNLGPGGGVQVTSVVTGTYQGIGTTTTQTPPTGSGGSCGGSGQPACAMDTSGMPTDTSLSAAQTAFDSAAAAREATISGVTATTMEAHETTLLSYFTNLTTINWPSGACVNPVIGVGSHLGTVPMCEHADDIKNGVGWFLGVISAFSCAFAALRAVRGA